jgi:hypothetical protein
MKVWKLAPIGLLALVAMGGAAQAGPASGAAQAAAAAKVEAGSGVTEVGRRWRRGGWRRGVGIGLGAAIVGGIIANEIYRPRYGYRYYDDYSYDGPYYAPSGYGGDARTLCAQNFRSFEWRTGLYTTYEGDKRLCPYLR